jgi:predicted anti-sigma-YlaC factor YlaD
MSDCPNAEIRDLLPDFVHGTLAGTERAPVESHLASCADCTSEVSLLRTVRGALAAGAPPVDVASVVRALPAPPSSVVRPSVPGVVSIEEARRDRRAPARTVGWWRAAAVLLVAAGATTVAVMQGGRSGSSEPPPTLVRPPGVTAPAVATAGLSLAAGVSDLSDDDLVALLGDIDDLEAAPATEPAALLPDMTGEGSE